jgi:DNA repair exonuclease SbcCD ATPase subunit
VDLRATGQMVQRSAQRMSEAQGLRRQVETDIVRLQTTLENLERAHTEAVANSAVLQLSLEYLKKLIDLMSEAGLKKLEAMLSRGLSTIFEDRGYRVEIEVDDRGKDKVARIWLLENTEDGLRRTLLQSNGFGVQAMASLILRVFFICHFNSRRLLIMDESLSQVSTEYLDGLFSFMRALIQDLEFTILGVTHDPRFLPYADAVYSMRDGHLARTLDGVLTVPTRGADPTKEE